MNGAPSGQGVSRLQSFLDSALNFWKRQISAVLPYRPLVGGGEAMDEAYATGDWEYLRGIEELPRFSVVAGLCHFLKRDGTILEIGCGDGILHDRLDPSRFSRFVGVDVSTEAIERAVREQGGASTFIAADATEFEPSAPFDLIVFNEVLEYFPDPLAVIRRFDRHLRKDGLHIVSMFVGHDNVRTRKIWRMLEASYETVTETRVTNDHRFTWVIRALRPLGSGTDG